MQINMNSWHYRTANMFNWDISRSLCVYFWQVVWGVLVWWLFMPVFGAIVALIVFGGLPAATGKGLLTVFTEGILIGQKWHDVFWSLGVGYVFWLIFIALVAGWVYFKEQIWNKRTKKEKVKKPDSLFVAYVKAKKRKICPILEFTKGVK